VGRNLDKNSGCEGDYYIASSLLNSQSLRNINVYSIIVHEMFFIAQCNSFAQIHVRLAYLFFPMPQPDPERSHGCSSCTSCTAGTCNGHYLKPQVLLELQTNDTTSAIAKPFSNPPSDVILATFKKQKVPSLQIIQETAKRCC
jgi:hypothetical protein